MLDANWRAEWMGRLAKAGWVFHGEGLTGRQEWLYPGLPRVWNLRQAVLIEFDVDLYNPRREGEKDGHF